MLVFDCGERLYGRIPAGYEHGGTDGEPDRHAGRPDSRRHGCGDRVGVDDQPVGTGVGIAESLHAGGRVGTGNAGEHGTGDAYDTKRVRPPVWCDDPPGQTGSVDEPSAKPTVPGRTIRPPPVHRREPTTIGMHEEDRRFRQVCLLSVGAAGLPALSRRPTCE